MVPFPPGNAAASPARLRRLARKVGLAAHALADAPTVVEARRIVLAAGAPSPAVVVALERHLAGAPDPALEAAQRIGLPVEAWLGTHENLVDVVRDVVARAVADSAPADPELVADATRAVLGSLPHEVWRAAWARWVARVRPDGVRHLGSLLPAGTDAGPARRALLTTLAAAGHDVRRSPVHAVEAWQTGRRDDLVDWEAEELASSTDPTRGRRVLTLRCGLDVRADVLDPAGLPEPVFSARELLRRDLEPDFVAQPAAEAAVPPAATHAASSAWFPALDGLLVLLGDAVVRGWRPPAWAPSAPAAQVPDPRAFAVLWEALPLLGDRVELPAVAGLVGVPSGDDSARAAWRAGALLVLVEAARSRWRDGLVALSAAAKAVHPGRTAFRRGLLGWLGDRVARDPSVRRCRCDDVPFEIDLVNRPSDVRLIAHATRVTGADAAVLTWIVNHWSQADPVLEALSTPGQPARVHGTYTALHHGLLASGMSPGAFRTAVSEAGRVPWCFDELDRAVARTRPRGTSPEVWRKRCATRMSAVPPEPWSRGWGCGPDAGLDRVLRSVGWRRGMR